MSTATKSQDQPFRPPMVSLVMAAVFGYASYWLYEFSIRGMELAILGAFFAAAVGIQQVYRAMRDHSLVRTIKRQNKRHVESKKKKGDARFATESDLEASKDFSYEQGIFLGSFRTPKRRSRDVFYCGPGSISCIAPPGQFKTTGLVTPAVASGVGRGDDLIINCISGELLSILTPFLEQQNYDIVLMTPCPDDVSAIIGRDVVDTGLKIFSEITPEMSPADVPAALERCMKWFMPVREDMPQEKKYFYLDAHRIGKFLSMREMAHGRAPNPVNLRSALATGVHGMVDLYAEESESTAFDGDLAETANALLGLASRASDQYAGGHGIADSFLDVFRRGSRMAAHVSGEGFDPSVFKKQGKKTAVFVSYTLKNFETYAPVMAMTMSYLLDQAASASGSRGVTALIDETASLPMYQLPEKLEFYRKANIRCLMIWQSMGQAEQRFGKTGLERILDASAVKIGMGLSGPDICEKFSKMCGTMAVESSRLSHQAIQAPRGPDQGSSLGYEGVPILRPEEIRRLKQMLVIGPGMQPLLLDIVPYWRRPSWARLAGPSPFHT